MVNYFDKLYTNIVDKNKFLARIKFYSVHRVIVRLVVNIIIPIYYSITKNSSQKGLSQDRNSEKKLIVSVTTFPARINRIWIVIESILRQTHKPDMVILWLSKEQFTSMEKIPRKLINQQKRGLQIRFCNGDLKSHKKYYYTLKEYPEDFLITVDDDIIYHTTMIAELVELNKKYPSSICCQRASYIKINNNKVLPYCEWGETKGKIGPDYNIFQTSGGGTLFPPRSLHTEVFNENVFKKLCFYADDVWLNIMSRLNGTAIVKTNYNSVLLPLINFNNVNLYKSNVILGENDKQLSATRYYYIEKLGVDALANCI